MQEDAIFWSQFPATTQIKMHRFVCFNLQVTLVCAVRLLYTWYSNTKTRAPKKIAKGSGSPLPKKRIKAGTQKQVAAVDTDEEANSPDKTNKKIEGVGSRVGQRKIKAVRPASSEEDDGGDDVVEIEDPTTTGRKKAVVKKKATSSKKAAVTKKVEQTKKPKKSSAKKKKMPATTAAKKVIEEKASEDESSEDDADGLDVMLWTEGALMQVVQPSVGVHPDNIVTTMISSGPSAAGEKFQMADEEDGDFEDIVGWQIVSSFSDPAARKKSKGRKHFMAKDFLPTGNILSVDEGNNLRRLSKK